MQDGRLLQVTARLVGVVFCVGTSRPLGIFDLRRIYDPPRRVPDFRFSSAMPPNAGSPIVAGSLSAEA